MCYGIKQSKNYKKRMFKKQRTLTYCLNEFELPAKHAFVIIKEQPMGILSQLCYITTKTLQCSLLTRLGNNKNNFHQSIKRFTSKRGN